jgi:hypothetical protein
MGSCKLAFAGVLAGLPLIVSSCTGSLLHTGKVETTLILSQGFRHGDTIFFLADYHRYHPGRTFWFILPLKSGPKTLCHLTLLYSLDTRTRTLRREAVLADPAQSTCTVSYTQWVMRGNDLFFSYNPGNRISPESGHTERIVFRRDMTGGAVSALPNPEEAYCEFFASYKSPWSANPGVTEIPDYKPLLPAKGWDLPGYHSQQWQVNSS